MMATQAAAKRKQAERDGLIEQMQQQLGDFTPADEVYVQPSAVQIVKNMTEKKEGWTAERVMQAFIRSAIQAQTKTNCLTEIMFEEALQTARELDASGEIRGRFHGLPVSFKDTYNILGKDSSLGCSIHTGKPTTDAEEESTLVKITRQAGGIPFCKTNVPQTLLAFECSNPIFGRSLNPYSSRHTCGGSSGGEAALLALNGSAIGWGSDIGGSVRIPASYCGIYGLKTVQGRMPTLGGRSSHPGFEGIKACTGPMTRFIEDLELACQVVAEATCDFRGEQVLRLPWREVDVPKKLVVGWYVEDECIKTSPACARAVKEAVDAMRHAGHEVREFKPPDVWQALHAFVALSSADAYKTLLSNRGPDPLEPSLKLVTLGPSLPSWIRWLISWIVLHVVKDWFFAVIFGESRKKSVQEYNQWCAKREAYARKFRQAAWEKEKFDMIICPVQAIPAIEHGKTKFLSPLCIGTVLYNVADSTVGVLPVTKVDSTLDRLPNDFLHDAKGSKLINKRVYVGAGAAYDADKMHGLPVGVQVVGRAWEEEKMLGMMRQVEAALKR